jgi:ABC-2 type transport system ATP-binding protein
LYLPIHPLRTGTENWELSTGTWEPPLYNARVPQPVLEFNRVSKTYRNWLGKVEHQALTDFSLSVFPGEIVGFLGPNGAGKTTAIHIALGLCRPSSGSGTLLGNVFGDVRSRRRVGFLAENVAFYHLSALQVVRFYGKLNGMSEPELTRRAHRLLEQLELAETGRGRSIAKFSRGMLQRVGLAQALVNDPELLILDEPTSALDPGSRQMVRNLLRQFKAAGKSVFLSSHMLSEVESVCDRVVLLKNGRVVLEGKTGELLQSQDRFEIVLKGAAAWQPPPDAGDLSRDQSGNMRFTVPAGRQRQVIEGAWAAGAELMSVTPSRRTLEELFLEFTGEKPANEAPAQRP